MVTNWTTAHSWVAVKLMRLLMSLWMGQTVSTDFPLKRALQGSLGGNADAFVAWITGDCIDTDEDGVCDSVDNCLSVYNPLQEDTDLDGVGDSCDVCPLDSADDIDQDGYCADEDNCPSIFNPGQEDPDTDGYGTPCDNCPTDFNPDQMDSDLDEQGDSCDICPFDMHDDYDDDGICGDVDNCPGVWNPDQLDADSNGIGDVCEGCCIGTVGNVDGSEEEEPDISDMQRLIDHLFVSMAPLGCLEEADIDRSGGTEPLPVDIDIADMQLMIDHLFINMEPFLSCP